MCETACTFFHTGSVNRNKSRIKVESLYGIGIDSPVVCVSCEEKFCLDCPVDAITTGKNGEIIVTPTSCILCKKCEKNCPIGAIEVFDDIVFVCDLCGGSPKCAEACTEGALKYEPAKIVNVSLDEFKEITEKMNSSEKRSYYVKEMGKKTRVGWVK